MSFQLTRRELAFAAEGGIFSATTEDKPRGELN